ncbi:MAG: thioredoxin family protein [Candidatus Aenigmatarchaeota archaeon]
MVKVQLLYTDRCTRCPAVKEMFRDLQKQFNFDYEEIDALSERGQEIVSKHNIMSVPTILINGEVVFNGVPTREKIITEIMK